ncbi:MULTISPECIES: entericidin A/B family lipoprotein [Halomonas]|uniref:Entericidin A/B family lipoprotein n=1 Tax=Halomonas citrativorans TaxID=2742612 RepID=A0A1R4I161_9GAMM|nr:MULTISPECIES: entericidin A/B family lipoprotein [Halomonas]MBE0403508.1 entericidin A/B family lipoprotein [Halomonas citrativorans]SJN13542.1 hypothetical protein CZ787_10620 [Halomonas citrativorans]HCR96975.1 entericidin, EcnA/B family [Halomonas sp.]
MKRTWAMGVVLLTTLLAISGCNTIHGAGEDISEGGQAIERAAE